MHNKNLINLGFYLLLFLAFTLSVAPYFAFVIAGAIFIIWLIDALIFRELELADLPLFYPIIGFALFLMIAGLVAQVYHTQSHWEYIGLYFMVYFIVPGFIATIEQRRMILWTFIAGVVSITVLHLIYWWGQYSNSAAHYRPLEQPNLSMIILSLGIIAAFFIENAGIRDKIFLLLVASPMVMAVFISKDKATLMALFVIMLLGGLLRSKMLLLLLILAIVAMSSGIFGINYYAEKFFSLSEYKEFIQRPIHEVMDNKQAFDNTEFYGANLSDGSVGTAAADSGKSSTGIFLLDLLRISGPLSLVLFLWIMVERFREVYFKCRRMAAGETRPYQLAVLLTISAVFIMNIYDSIYYYPQVILASWTLWGMSEK